MIRFKNTKIKKNSIGRIGIDSLKFDVKKLIEMPITIPDEKKPKNNLKILKDYYDSLNHFLEKSNY